MGFVLALFWTSTYPPRSVLAQINVVPLTALFQEGISLQSLYFGKEK